MNYGKSLGSVRRYLYTLPVNDSGMRSGGNLGSFFLANLTQNSRFFIVGVSHSLPSSQDFRFIQKLLPFPHVHRPNKNNKSS